MNITLTTVVQLMQKWKNSDSESDKLWHQSWIQ